MFFLRPAGLRRVDGGDRAEYDFEIGDLTRDGAFHDLDLSSIIPANAKLVDLQLVIRNTAAGYSGQFRKKGNTNNHNNAMILTPYALKTITGRVSVIPNISGIVEYMFDTGGWDEIDLQVLSWWI